MNMLDAYQEFVGRECLRKHYGATLEKKPWDDCKCAICSDVGIEVIIFSGNNRNRRRGFHNTRVFYDLLGHSMRNETDISIERTVNPMYESVRQESTQMSMF